MPAICAIGCAQNLRPACRARALRALLRRLPLAASEGLQPAVLIQNGNEGFALIMVAMAQTVPVLAGGLDLSVGA